MVTTQPEMGASRKMTSSNIFLFTVCGNASKNETELELAANIPIGRAHIAPDAQQPLIRCPTTLD